MSDENADDGRRPIEEVLAGFGIHPLPEKAAPVEAFVLVKYLDEDGSVTWSYRTTSPPNREELLGALVVQVEVLRRELTDGWLEE